MVDVVGYEDVNKTNCVELIESAIIFSDFRF
jgi:hypothetical protein